MSKARLEIFVKFVIEDQIDLALMHSSKLNRERFS